MLPLQVGRKKPSNGWYSNVVMNNTTLFTVCYNIKASPCIQRGTLVLAGLKPLGSNSDLPRTARGEPVTAGIKGQLQKLAGSFQLVHYTKSAVLLIALTLGKSHLKKNKTYCSTSQWDQAGPPAPISQTLCLPRKAFKQAALARTIDSFLSATWKSIIVLCHLAFSAVISDDKLLIWFFSSTHGWHPLLLLRDTAESIESSICLQWNGKPREIDA